MEIDLAAVVDAISEGLYIVDADRRIVFWSRGAENITGWKASEVVGSHCEDGILEHVDYAGHKLCQSEFCPLARSIRTGESLRVPSIVYSLSRGKRRIPVEVTTAPWRDARGRIIGGIEVFRDMSTAMVDMQAARTIQLDAMAGLPAGTDGIAFQVVYHPHDLVGGDFYRVEQADASRWSFLLADVTSHGVSAALFTLLLRSLWDQARDLRASPSALAGKLNTHLSIFGGQVGYFASGLVGVLDTATLTLTLCSMGSPPFFQISRRNGVSVHELPGPLLGAEENASFEQRMIPLERGDRLLFVTDGSFEVENAQGTAISEPYGIERLKEKVATFAPNTPLEEFCSEVEKDLLDFSGRLQLADDFSALLVTVE
jgi:PAS domain S-box-containing protein